MDEPLPRRWRAHAALAALVPSAWAFAHLGEQWAAFGGRATFVRRLATTAFHPLALPVELLLVILPLVAWAVLELRLLRAPDEPPALAAALAEDPATARRLALLATGVRLVLLAFLAYHAAWLWLPKLLGGADPVGTWLRLRMGMGTLAHASAHAIGLTALTVHIACAVPRVFVSEGWVDTVESRRAARLSGLIVALGLFLLYAELAGWHATGAGTLWPL